MHMQIEGILSISVGVGGCGGGAFQGRRKNNMAACMKDTTIAKSK